MTLSELKKALEDWVCSLYPGKVIWMKGDNPIPARPFIALDLKNPKPQGRPYQSPADPAGTIERRTTMQFSVTIQAYGSGANQSLLDLRESLDLMTVQKILHGVGISHLTDLTDVQDSTTKTGSRYEEQAVYEPAFIYKQIRTEEVGYIEEVKIKGVCHGRR